MPWVLQERRLQTSRNEHYVSYETSYQNVALRWKIFSLTKKEGIKNMISLTNDQRNRLINAASKLRIDERSALTLNESQVIADRIDKVLYELHMENAQAFVTSPSASLGGPEFLAIHSLVRRRKFYDEPTPHSIKSNEYGAYVRPLPRGNLL